MLLLVLKRYSQKNKQDVKDLIGSYLTWSLECYSIDNIPLSSIMGFWTKIFRQYLKRRAYTSGEAVNVFQLQYNIRSKQQWIFIKIVVNSGIKFTKLSGKQYFDLIFYASVSCHVLLKYLQHNF